MKLTFITCYYFKLCIPPLRKCVCDKMSCQNYKLLNDENEMLIKKFGIFHLLIIKYLYIYHYLAILKEFKKQNLFYDNKA